MLDEPADTADGPSPGISFNSFRTSEWAGPESLQGIPGSQQVVPEQQPVTSSHSNGVTTNGLDSAAKEDVNNRRDMAPKIYDVVPIGGDRVIKNVPPWNLL